MLTEFRNISLTIALLFPLLSFCQTGGNNTYEFLNLPASARSASMGGHVVSLRDSDLNLVADNPALLDSNMHNHLSISYVNYLADINLGYVAYARKLGKAGVFSQGIQYINYGMFTETNAAAQELGTFTAGEYAFITSYARPLDSLFSVGGSMKLIYSTLEQYKSFGIVVDAGATYMSRNKNFSAGLVVKNAGAQLKAYNSKNNEPLPFEIQTGISKRFKHAPLRVTMLLTNLQKWDLTWYDPSAPDAPPIDPITGEPIIKLITFDKLMRHVVIGTEFMPSPNFNLSLSYNYQRKKEMGVASRGGMTGFAFGAGFKISKFRFSYGRAAYHLAGASNHITIITNISDLRSKRQSGKKKEKQKDKQKDKQKKKKKEPNTFPWIKSK